MKYTLKDMLYLMRLRGTNTNSESGGSGEESGSSSSCFWDDPAVVEYLSAGIGEIGSILNAVDHTAQTSFMADHLNEYLPTQTLDIIFPPAEESIVDPFAILPCRIFIKERESENEVEVRFTTSAGSYSYSGYIVYIRNYDTETGGVRFDNGEEVEIWVAKCAIPESES